MICKHFQLLEATVVVIPTDQGKVLVFVDAFRLKAVFSADSAVDGLEKLSRMMAQRLGEKVSFHDNEHDASLVFLPGNQILIARAVDKWFLGDPDDYEGLISALRSNGYIAGDEVQTIVQAEGMRFNQLKAIVEQASAVPETA